MLDSGNRSSFYRDGWMPHDQHLLLGLRLEQIPRKAFPRVVMLLVLAYGGCGPRLALLLSLRDISADISKTADTLREISGAT